MAYYEKYHVDDLETMKNIPDSVSKAIRILELYPDTGEEYRQKIAKKLENTGFLALSAYLLNSCGYEKFYVLAEQEKKERLKKRPLDIINYYPYTKLEKLLKETKQRREFYKNKHVSDIQYIKVKHEKEILNLQKKHRQEIETFERVKTEIEKKIEKEILELEHKIKLQNDPAYAEAYHAEQQKKREAQERVDAERRFLRAFELSFIDPNHREYIIPILRKLDLGERLSEFEFVWLKNDGNKYFLKGSKVYRMYHEIEARHYLNLFDKERSNLWNAVNASAHLRKAEFARDAENLLERISSKKIPEKKLKSAFFTTLGGVKRDLNKFNEGMEKATFAHELSPKDYRPCTLLGALYFELQEYGKGHQWFEKAEQLGASKKNTDAEIRAIYKKADKATKEKLKKYLLSQDPQRYAWLNKTEN